MQTGASVHRMLLRRWLPPVGALALAGYVLASTDLDQVAAAVGRADLPLFLFGGAVSTVLAWCYDSLCLVWLLRATLGHGAASDGQPPRAGLTAILPLKASSYILNMLNYHAASIGMAYLIGRRRAVPFLEAAGALAVLSYLDLIAVTAMAMVGIWAAPGFFGPYPGLQIWLQTVAVLVFAGALSVALLLQSSWQAPWLQRLRGLAPLRPLVRLTPRAMVSGLLLRLGLILLYASVTFGLMSAFGMRPSWGRLFVAVPILTVVGTIPISVSGFGSTQVLMRSFYAPFVAEGQPAQAVVDAFSTLYIVSFLGWRLVIALPFLRAISAELRGQQDAPAATVPPAH